MDRRTMLKSSMSVSAGVAVGAAVSAVADDVGGATASGRPFKLKYAPHFGMFQNCAGGDPVDQLKFAVDQGFRAWEDNGFKGRGVDEQRRIGDAMQKLGVEMGVFVACFASGADFVRGDAAAAEAILKEVRDSVEPAKRCRARWLTLVPGNYDLRLEEDFQTANCVELLRRIAEILEPHNLTVVLEALNWKTNHPGVFLHKTSQAYEICRAVDSPSVKILYDIYHMQIEEGNLIPTLDAAWDEIGYLQCGDNPGRNEPGTGEINYRNVFRHVHGKGYAGIVGMEHGNAQPGKEGEEALISAYREADNF